MIEGVYLKPLITHTDKRGYFRELIRSTDGFFDKFGQWSMSMMLEKEERIEDETLEADEEWDIVPKPVIKAWHIHQIQTDHWYIPPFGAVRVALCDMRELSLTFGQIDKFLFGDRLDQAVLTIPPGVAHGLKVLQGPAYLFYITSEVYNPDDEGRISIDEIDYDWGE